MVPQHEVAAQITITLLKNGQFMVNFSPMGRMQMNAMMTTAHQEMATRMLAQEAKMAESQIQIAPANFLNGKG